LKKSFTRSSVPLRVCYFGTYRANYARNRLMIAHLRGCGVKVIECHEQLWHGIQDRVQAVKGKWLRPAFWWRVFRAYGNLLWHYRIIEDYDLMIVGYPGHLDVFLARVLTWIRGRPLVWDVMMSIYLISIERQLNKHSWIGRITSGAIRRVERFACKLPESLLTITPEYVDWFQETHGIPPERFQVIPLSTDDRLLKPVTGDSDQGIKGNGKECFRAVYYGSFVPAHGTRYIIEAARLLADDETIQFELIGMGGDRDKVVSLSESYGLSNVSFPGFVDDKELIRRLNRANICLASFGTTPHSLITVHNKVFEILALAKPLIIGKAPALRRHFNHREHLYYCERENGQALANAIRLLRQNEELCETMARNSHRYYADHFTTDIIGPQLKQHLLEIVQPRTQQ
jgi:glycosyltransferase involved in cell wall biosynthesis